MKKIVLGFILACSIAGCASNMGKLVINCTTEAGNNALPDIVSALSNPNYEELIAAMTYPVGKFLAEDIACVIKGFLENTALAADPQKMTARTNAKAYLNKRHYEVK